MTLNEARIRIAMFVGGMAGADKYGFLAPWRRLLWALNRIALAFTITIAAVGAAGALQRFGYTNAASWLLLVALLGFFIAAITIQIKL